MISAFFGSGKGLTPEQVLGIRQTVVSVSPKGFGLKLNNSSDFDFLNIVGGYKIPVHFYANSGTKSWLKDNVFQITESETEEESVLLMIKDSDLVIVATETKAEMKSKQTWKIANISLKQGKETIIIMPDGSDL